MHDLDALVSQARSYLVDKGYARSTIAHHEAAWKRLVSWCEDESVEGYDHDVERRFIEEVVMANADATKYFKLDKRRVLLLLSVDEAGGPPDREAKRRFVVPAGFAGAYSAYAAELEGRGLVACTREGYLCTVRNFCESCGAMRPEELDARFIGIFAEAVSHCAPQTRSGKLYVARDFARFLARIGMCGPEVAAAAPLIPGHKHSTVPSAYSAAVISPMLEGLPRSLRPKRDRAIMLLATVLGMRAGDLCRMWRGSVGDLAGAKQSVSSFLLGRGIVWDERTPDGNLRSTWTRAYAEWHSTPPARPCARADAAILASLRERVDSRKCVLSSLSFGRDHDSLSDAVTNFFRISPWKGAANPPSRSRA